MRENVSLYVLRVKIQAGALAVGDDTKQKKISEPGCVTSRRTNFLSVQNLVTIS